MSSGWLREWPPHSVYRDTRLDGFVRDALTPRTAARRLMRWLVEIKDADADDVVILDPIETELLGHGQHWGMAWRGHYLWWIKDELPDLHGQRWCARVVGDGGRLLLFEHIIPLAPPTFSAVGIL